jgi:hypothetical protein
VDELAELRESIAGTRSAVKSAMRTCRGALGMLVDLERRLAEFEQTQSQEAERGDQPDRNGASAVDTAQSHRSTVGAAV